MSLLFRNTHQISIIVISLHMPSIRHSLLSEVAPFERACSRARSRGVGFPIGGQPSEGHTEGPSPPQTGRPISPRPRLQTAMALPVLWKRVLWAALSNLTLPFLLLVLTTVHAQSTTGSSGRTLCHLRPLRVFVYDLHQKFNFGLFEPLEQDLNSLPHSPVVNAEHSGTAAREVQRASETASLLPERLTNKFAREADGRPKGRGFEHSGEYFLLLDLLARPLGRGAGFPSAQSAAPDPSAPSSSAWPAGPSAPCILRVLDPAEADVFFVPFLSSASFNRFSARGMAGHLAETDKRLQEELLRLLLASPWWQRSGGVDHLLPSLHPNALRHIRRNVSAATFLLLDFGRCDSAEARLSKDVVLPYRHMAPPFAEEDPREEAPEGVGGAPAEWEPGQSPGGAGASDGGGSDPWSRRDRLLFFVGTLQRKNEGYIRQLLYERLRNDSQAETDVVFQDHHMGGQQDVLAAAAGLRRSRFCLHLAGDTPSSCRLFDAVASHCVPVIVSNHIELPFERQLDWSEFAVFLAHEDALRKGYLLGLLRAFPRQRWLQMWRRLRQVKHHFEFQFPSQPDDAVSMAWQEVQWKRSRMALALNRRRRLVGGEWARV